MALLSSLLSLRLVQGYSGRPCRIHSPRMTHRSIRGRSLPLSDACDFRQRVRRVMRDNRVLNNCIQKLTRANNPTVLYPWESRVHTNPQSEGRKRPSKYTRQRRQTPSMSAIPDADPVRRIEEKRSGRDVLRVFQAAARTRALGKCTVQRLFVA